MHLPQGRCSVFRSGLLCYSSSREALKGRNPSSLKLRKGAVRRAAALIKDFHFGARTRPPHCAFLLYFRTSAPRDVIIGKKFFGSKNRSQIIFYEKIFCIRQTKVIHTLMRKNILFAHSCNTERENASSRRSAQVRVELALKNRFNTMAKKKKKAAKKKKRL